MRILFAFLFALLIVAHGSISANAQSIKGDVQEFLSWCRRDQSDEFYGYCLQYIARVSDWMWHVEEMPMKAVGCPRGVASHDARVQAFINWAEKNPKRWNAPRRVGVRAAISETWPGPCKS